MSKQLFLNGTIANLGTATITVDMYGSRLAAAPNWANSLMSVGGVLDKLLVDMGSSPGAGKSYTFTVYQNGGATGLTVTISDTDTQGEDSSNTVTVTAGDRLTMVISTSGTPAARPGRWCATWTPTTADETQMCCTLDTTQLSTSATEYLPLAGCFPAPRGSGDLTQLYFPTAGTLKNLYVYLSQSPGGGRKNRQFQLDLNNVAQAALSVNIADATISGNDTTGSIAVADGDSIRVRSQITGKDVQGPFASYVSIGVTFVPDTPGLFLVPCVGHVNLPTGDVTRSAQPVTGWPQWGTVASAAVFDTCQLTRIRVHTTSAPPDPGDSWVFVLGSTALRAAITSSSGVDVAEDYELHVAAFNGLSMNCIATSIPASDPYDKTRASVCIAGQFVRKVCIDGLVLLVPA